MMCEYCEPNKDNKCKPMMKCLDKLNGYERIKIHHVRPCKMCPNCEPNKDNVRPCKMCPTQDYWRLDCERFGVFVGVKINYCPMCGRQLTNQQPPSMAKDNKMKATKKPVTIECLEWTGENPEEIKAFCGKSAKLELYHSLDDGLDHINLTIHTLEGDMLASVGDFIIKGVNGELYPCKPDIFEKTYDIETSDNTACVPDDNEYGFTHDFSWALRMMKNGCRIHRSVWNGKGMFAVLQKGYPDGIPCNKQTAEAWGLNEGDLFRCEPYMQLKMVNGSHSMWVPSVNDCLSNDWAITG